MLGTLQSCSVRVWRLWKWAEEAVRLSWLGLLSSPAVLHDSFPKGPVCEVLLDSSEPLDPRLTTGKRRARARPTKRELSEQRRANNHRAAVKAFVEHYKETGDLTAAITVSGLSRGQAKEIVETHPELREDVCLTLARAGVTPERVIQEIGRIALCDPRQLFDEHGQMRPVNEWPDDVARAVSGLDATHRSYGEDEDRVSEVTYKPRFWDKPAMLRELVRMLRMGGTEVEPTSPTAVAVQKIEVVIVAPGQAAQVGAVGLIEQGAQTGGSE